MEQSWRLKGSGTGFKVCGPSESPSVTRLLCPHLREPPFPVPSLVCDLSTPVCLNLYIVFSCGHTHTALHSPSQTAVSVQLSSDTSVHTAVQ